MALDKLSKHLKIFRLVWHKAKLDCAPTENRKCSEWLARWTYRLFVGIFIDVTWTFSLGSNTPKWRGFFSFFLSFFLPITNKTRVVYERWNWEKKDSVTCQIVWIGPSTVDVFLSIFPWWLLLCIHAKFIACCRRQKERERDASHSWAV